MIETAFVDSPIGILKIEGDTEGVSGVSMLDEKEPITETIPAVLEDCVYQLNEYFEGKRVDFSIKLNLKGTDFQRKVWQELCNIPHGKTRTYFEQTKAIGDVKAIRAVASANGKNPVSIIIPCHRVIGSDGSLTGYAGGLWRKKWLLEHENCIKQTSLFQ